MLYIDQKYVSLISSQLPNFKQRGDYLWNFRCVICGDSSKKKNKARGYIYMSKGVLLVKCHNCGYGASFSNFLKYLDPRVFQEYSVEKYRDTISSKRVINDQAVPEIFKRVENPLRRLKSLDQLSETHPAVRYVRSRKIPDRFFSKLYFAPKFFKYINSVIPNKFEEDMMKYDHPRLIIPFYDRLGNCFAVQGRAFGQEDPKYITIKFDPTAEKIFGLERFDAFERAYITEGPLDSLFLPNALAVSGATLNTPFIQKIKSKCVIVYDNEPRSKEITFMMEKMIEQGFSICLWPDNYQHKDINEGIMNGYSAEDIKYIIDNNTFAGIGAKLKFAHWRKTS